MFCKNCGNELADDALFCPKCGKNVNQSMGSEAKRNITKNIKPIGKEYVLKAKDVIKISFSKEPLEAVKKMAEEESFVGILFILIHAILFAFGACLYLTQITNYALEYIIGKLNLLIESAMSFGDLFSSQEKVIPIVKISVEYDRFGWFFLATLIVCAIETVEIYFILRIQKKQSSLAKILNVIALANMPVITGTILSIIIGFIFPPLVFAVCILAFILHMIYIYKGIKELTKQEREPFWEFAVFTIVLSIILVIFCLFFVNMSVNTLLRELQDKLYSLEDSMNSLLNMF